MIGWLKEKVVPRRNQPTRAQVLGSRPVRNPAIQWTRALRVESDRVALVLLKVPRRADKIGNLIARWFKLPDHKKIELDEIGSDVWEMCDGRTTVEALTRAICASYRLNRRQGETSVTAYLRMLAQRRLIGVRPTESRVARQSGRLAPVAAGGDASGGKKEQRKR